MPSPTTTRRPTTSAGRFSRQQPTPSGRFPVPGRRPAQPSGRSAGQRKPAGIGRKSTAAPSRFQITGRKQQQKSGLGKALGSLTSMLSSSSSKKKKKSSGSSGKRAGGMALLAGGVGLAMKNRDKITGMLHRGDDHQHEHQHPSSGMAGTPPTTPPADSTMPSTPPRTTP